MVSLLTVTTISYAKARGRFRDPILFGILVLILTIVLRYFENSMWLRYFENSMWEMLWYPAFGLYMAYFALIPAMIWAGYFEE